MKPSSHRSNCPNPGNSPASDYQSASLTDGSLGGNEASDVLPETVNTRNDEAQGQTTLHQKELERNLATNRSALDDNSSNLMVSSDLWSAAYYEAVESFGEKIDVAALEGKDVAQLFKELVEIERGATNESSFLRGVKRLRAIEPGLQNLKLALDLASPLANFEPTARTVVGVVSSVTAVSSTHENMTSRVLISRSTQIAISFASADWTLRSKLRICWSKYPILMNVIRLVRKRTGKIFTR